MTDTLKTVIARITGRVQGVSFRQWTRREALGLGLTGWVRNETDGSVTALLHGPAFAVDAMTDRLWHGPPDALVEGVSTEKAEGEDNHADFTVMR